MVDQILAFPVKLFETGFEPRDATEMDFDFAKVLLVDDDPASRLTLKTVLELSGYTVDCAASAAERANTRAR